MMVKSNRFDEWECYKLSDCDFDKQCQGTPGRCIDPCTNDVNTGEDMRPEASTDTILLTRPASLRLWRGL